MDWGLFDKNAGENTFLREGIVYPQKVRMQPALTLGKACNIWTKLAEFRACCSWPLEHLNATGWDFPAVELIRFQEIISVRFAWDGAADSVASWRPDEVFSVQNVFVELCCPCCSSGILLLCHRGRCHPAFRVDHPDLPHFHADLPLRCGHHFYRVCPTRGVPVRLLRWAAHLSLVYFHSFTLWHQHGGKCLGPWTWNILVFIPRRLGLTGIFNPNRVLSEGRGRGLCHSVELSPSHRACSSFWTVT